MGTLQDLIEADPATAPGSAGVLAGRVGGGKVREPPPRPAGEDASAPRGGERPSGTVYCLEPGTNFGDVVLVAEAGGSRDLPL